MSSLALQISFALRLAKPPQGADKPYFSVQELSWEVFFNVSMERTLGQHRSRESGYTKPSLPARAGKRYLPMGERASVATAIVSHEDVKKIKS